MPTRQLVADDPGLTRSSAAAYVALKQMILDSELAPGSQILEQKLANDLDMSRTPVREALVRLEQEGLLQIVPRHGARIATVAPSDMREIYEILVSLESTAVELVTRRRPRPNEIAPLVRACDAMEAALRTEPPDLKGWAQADAAFHAALVQLSGNRRLCAMVQTVSEQAHRARTFTLSLRPVPHRSTEEHRMVVDAMLGGDPDQARSLYEAHRRRGGEEVMSIIERHGLQHL